MKNTTYFELSKSILVLCFMLSCIHNSNAQCTLTGIDPRDCGYGCTSNDVTLNSVFLANSNAPECLMDLSEMYTADLCFNLTNNSGSTRVYSLAADYYINGVQVNVLMECFGAIPGGQTIDYCLTDYFNWQAGDVVELKNIWSGWTSASGSCLCANGGCSGGNNYIPPGKCNDSTEDIIIPTPPSVSFSWECGPTSRSVAFNNLSIGGTEPISYLWEFGDGATSNLENPTHTFADKNPYTTVLTMTDAEGRECTFMTVITPEDCCEFNAVCFLNDVSMEGCSLLDAPLPLSDYNEVFFSVSNIPCGDIIMISNDIDLGGSGCQSDPYIIERTYTIFDDCNFDGVLDDGLETTETCVQLITIMDSTTPILNCPTGGDLVLECGEYSLTDIDNWINSTSVSDNCSSNLVITNDYDPSLLEEPCASDQSPFELIVNFYVEDDCGLSASCSSKIIILDTTAPEITCPTEDLILECGLYDLSDIDLWISTIIVSDECDSEVSLTNDYNPANLNSPCQSNEFPFEMMITFEAEDNCGNTSTCVGFILIVDTTPPTEACPASGDLTLECGTFTLTDIEDWLNTAASTDECDSEVRITNNFNQGDLNAPCADGMSPFILEVGFVATDNCGNSTMCISTITIQDTESPVLDVAPTDLMLMCTGAMANNQINDWLSNNGGAMASDQCSDLVWSNDYNSVDGFCNQYFPVVFTATDNCGLSISATANIFINDDTPPQISVDAESKVVECDGFGNLDQLDTWLSSNGGSSASDNCSDIIWTNDFESLTDDCGATGSTIVTFIASDVCGNTSQTSASFTIEDTTQPSMDFEAQDLVVECDGNGNVSELSDWLESNGGAIATDVCGDFSWSNDFNGLIEDCGATGTVFVVFTATDDCGNTNETSASFTIEDTTDPEILIDGDNVVVECDGQGNLNELQEWLDNSGGLSVSDACSELSWTYDLQEVNYCFASKDYIATFTAIDECGNSSNAERTFSIVDTQAPVIQEEFDDITVECTAIPAAIELIAIDDCTGEMIIFPTDRIINQVCANTYTIERTWSFTDACGNTVSSVQLINVEDNTPPVLENVPGDLVFSCSEEVVFENNVSFTDNCGDDVAFRFDEEYVNFDPECPHNYTVLRTWTATDACGNESSLTQIIEVIDDEAPQMIADIPLHTYSECVVPEVVFEFSDNCDSDLDIVITEEIINQICPATYTIVKSWQVTDCTGNVDEGSVYIHIQDTTPPELSFNDPLLNGLSNGGVLEYDCALNEDGTYVLPSFTTESVESFDSCSEWEVSLTDNVIGEGNCKEDGYQLLIQCIFEAVDECGNSSSLSFFIKVVDNTAPKFTDLPASFLETECTNIPEPYEVKAIDECICVHTNLEEVYDDMGTDCVDDDILFRVYTASDHCGNETSFTQTIYLKSVSPYVESFEPADIDPTVALCEEDYKKIEAVPSDGCSMQIDFKYEEVALNENLCNPIKDIRRVYHLYDECGNYTTEHFDFKIVKEDYDLLEVFSSQNEFLQQVLFTDSIPSEGFIMRCSDNVGENEISLRTLEIGESCKRHFDIQFDKDRIDFDQCTEGVSSTIIYNWYIYSACGLMKEINMPVHFIDDVAPVIEFEENLSIYCGDALPEIKVHDECGYSQLSIDELIHDTECDFEKLVERRISASDACGNQSFATQYVKMLPGMPEFSVSNADCSENESPEFARAWHPCYAEFDFAAELEKTEYIQDCDDGSSLYERTWVATNPCGTTYRFIQNVYEDDKVAPRLLIHTFEEEILSEHMRINETEEDMMDMLEYFAENKGITAIDDCGQFYEVKLKIDTTFLDCDVENAFLRYYYEWTSTDACGNMSMVSFTADINDNIAPLILNAPEDEVIYCPENVTMPELEIVESNQYDVVFQEQVAANEIIRTWDIADMCGNMASHTQRVSLEYYGLNCSITVPDEIACNSNIRISAELEGGYPPFQYSWSTGKGDCFIAGDANKRSINLVTGFLPSVISVEIVDGQGCTTYCEVDVNCDAHSEELNITEEDNFNSLQIGVKDFTQSIESTDESLSFKVHPNPVVDDLIVTNFGEKFTYVIFSIDGKAVKSGKINDSSERIDLSNLPQGWYTFNAKTGTKNKVIKIVKR